MRGSRLAVLEGIYYLDTSALVKRHVREYSGEVIDIFDVLS